MFPEWRWYLLLEVCMTRGCQLSESVQRRRAAVLETGTRAHAITQLYVDSKLLRISLCIPKKGTDWQEVNISVTLQSAPQLPCQNTMGNWKDPIPRVGGKSWRWKSRAVWINARKLLWVFPSFWMMLNQNIFIFLIKNWSGKPIPLFTEISK